MKNETVQRRQRSVRMEQILKSQRNELVCKDWKNVYAAIDVDSAYNSFLDNF